MEGRPSEEISAAEAVLVGALSSGVNVRTFLLMAQNYCNEFHVQCLPSQFNSNSVSFHCGIVFAVVVFIILSIYLVSPYVVWHCTN